MRAYDADYYERFDDLDEAVEWARESAEAAGLPFIVLAESEAFVAGPVDEVDVLSEGRIEEVVGVFDADGEPSMLLESMFSDETEADDVVARMSHAVLAERAALRPPANEARLQRAFAARQWRREHMGVLEAWNRLGEMEVKNRSVFTRRQALQKKKTVMDKDRRRVARNAHNWRLRNKSRAKRYGSLYRGPKSKMKEAAVDAGPEWYDVVVDAFTGEIIREATADEVEKAIAGGDMVVERRRRPVVPPPQGHTPRHVPVLAGGETRQPAGGGL